MNSNPPAGNHKGVYLRLITLWVVCEAMLGGIIHGLRIPISGLLVGSAAVVCICLIAWYQPAKGAIIKATFIVAIFKMMLSPQAPPTAYVAVFFQGLMGELLFWNRRHFRLACIALGTLALLESGLQRILILTIVYGNEVWRALNDFIASLTNQKTPTNYSFIIGSAYVGIHLITGIIVGSIAAVIPGKVNQWELEKDSFEVSPGAVSAQKPGKKKTRVWLFVVWLALIILYVQSYFSIGNPILPAHVSLKILLRSMIIILAWYFIFSPLLKKMLHNWLERKRTRSAGEIQQIIHLLPGMKARVVGAWKGSANHKGAARIRVIIKTILAGILIYKKKMVHILTGSINSGKTSFLENWCNGRQDVAGVLSPVVDGDRMFMNIQTKEIFRMVADENEREVLLVGRYRFSKEAFGKAQNILRESKYGEGWLIIDEVGPLELRGEGFYEVIMELLQDANIKRNILFVVREGKINECLRVFDCSGRLFEGGVDEFMMLGKLQR